MIRPDRRRPVRAHGTAKTPTLIDEAESTAAGAQEMAAARLAVNVTEVLRTALVACKCQQQDLAERLNVSPGRVSQVLADGNVRIATLGRFARALGYQARIVLDPVEPGCPELPTRGARAETPLADMRFSGDVDFLVLHVKEGVDQSILRTPFLELSTERHGLPRGAVFQGIRGGTKHAHKGDSGGLYTSIKVKNVHA